MHVGVERSAWFSIMFEFLQDLGGISIIFVFQAHLIDSICNRSAHSPIHWHRFLISYANVFMYASYFFSLSCTYV